jgi:pimeloyl-ACP methyl ester carboxylesterase
MGPSLDTVVLVHGLWVRGIVMELMRRRVTRCGFVVLAYSYPSMRLTLTENAERLVRYCHGIAAPRLHLVGHSLGGLLVLRALERATDLPPGRIVLTGTPLTESFAARRLAGIPGGRAALGRSMTEWLDSPRLATPATHEVGIIAGNVPLGAGRVVAPDLPPPSDGVVSVAETRLAGMRDHIVLRVSHSAMLVSSGVARQICAFLRDGKFVHG